MIAAVDKCHRAIDHFEAQGTLAHRFADAVFYRGDPLLRHRAAVDLLLEHEAGAARKGLHFDDHVAKLPVAAGLLLVPALLRDRFADRFAIADRGRVALHLDAVPPFESRNYGVEMLVVDPA